MHHCCRLLHKKICMKTTQEDMVCITLPKYKYLIGHTGATQLTAENNTCITQINLTEEIYMNALIIFHAKQGLLVLANLLALLKTSAVTSAKNSSA